MKLETLKKFWIRSMDQDARVVYSYLTFPGISKMIMNYFHTSNRISSNGQFAPFNGKLDDTK